MDEKKVEKNEEQSVFALLSSLDVSEHVEKKVVKYRKSNTTKTFAYLSWVWAHSILMNIYGDNYKREWTRFDEFNPRTGTITGRKVDYCLTPNGAYVECTVTINGNPQTETLPVMDMHNDSPTNPSMMEINKAKQRCFVKACALHGLGLNLYAGEDLPMGFEPMTNKQKAIITDYCKNISQINGEGKGALYKDAIRKCDINDYENISKQEADNIIKYLENMLKQTTEENKAQEKVANTNE